MGVSAGGVSAGADVPASVVNELLGPTHGRGLDPAETAAIAHSIEGGLHTVFRLIAVLAAIGLGFALVFPDAKMAAYAK